MYGKRKRYSWFGNVEGEEMLGKKEDTLNVLVVEKCICNRQVA